MTYRHNWGKHYVYFYNQNDKLAWVDATWTDIGPKVPCNEISHGDSFFRVEDLLRLCGLLENIKREIEGEVLKETEDGVR